MGGGGGGGKEREREREISQARAHQLVVTRVSSALPETKMTQLFSSGKKRRSVG